MSDQEAANVLRVIRRQRRELETIQDSLKDLLPQWRDRTLRLLANGVVKEELRILAKISSASWEQEKELYLHFLSDLEKGVTELPDSFLIPDVLPRPDKSRARRVVGKDAKKKVFIVHGHDSLVKTDVARTVEKLGLDAIVLHEQPNEGKTIIEKFERDASQVSFAIALLTPDDVGYPENKPGEKKPRARQNVILELGYFCGILGRSNVCVLYKGNVEIPSDYLGVVYVQLDEAGAWRFNLAKELKRSGMAVDLNKLV